MKEINQISFASWITVWLDVFLVELAVKAHNDEKSVIEAWALFKTQEQYGVDYLTFEVGRG